MKIEFIKMHGCGNDFMLIDARVQKIILNKNKIIEFANRKTSVGFDQLILIKHSQDNNILLEFYNSNGTKADACGNGTRCAARYIFDKENISNVTFKVNNRIIKSWHDKNSLFSVNLGAISVFTNNSPYLVEIGNKHLIKFINELDDDIFNQEIKDFYKRQFFNNDVNISIAKIKTSSIILLKVWERGVGPTLACGTAAAATAYIASKFNFVKTEEIKVIQEGGVLTINTSDKNNIILTGETAINFKGTVVI